MSEHHPDTPPPKPTATAAATTTTTDKTPPPSSRKIPVGSSYPNRPETSIPDAATLREQWRYATRQYSKWYAHAWGTAILAGVSFFALGWAIKGSNPLPSFKRDDDEPKKG